MKRPSAAKAPPLKRPASRRKPAAAEDAAAAEVFPETDDEKVDQKDDDVFPESDAESQEEINHDDDALPKPPMVEDVGVESMVSEWLEELIDVRVQFIYGLRKLADFGDEVTLGSICTGWGVGDMVVHAVNNAVQARNHLLQGHVPGKYPEARMG
eukprot:s2323_g9.t1